MASELGGTRGTDGQRDAPGPVHQSDAERRAELGARIRDNMERTRKDRIPLPIALSEEDRERYRVKGSFHPATRQPLGWGALIDARALPVDDRPRPGSPSALSRSAPPEGKPPAGEAKPGRPDGKPGKPEAGKAEAGTPGKLEKPDKPERIEVGKIDFPASPLPGRADHYGQPLDRRFRGREPLFKGPPAREQAAQGALGDCGIVATMRAVAAHRPDDISKRVRQRDDGNYEVSLHDTRYSPETMRWEPTGKTTTLVVTPELPVSSDAPGNPAYANSGKARVAWPSIIEKGIAGVDQAWPEGEARLRHGDPPPSGYTRLDKGSFPHGRAELLTMLTGQPAGVREYPKDPGDADPAESRLAGKRLAQQFRNLLEDGKPILVGTRPKEVDEKRMLHGLFPNHVYEVVGVDSDDKIRLGNPWNHGHPEAMTPQQVMAHTHPYYSTLEK